MVRQRSPVPKRTLTVRLPVSTIERFKQVARDAAGMPTWATMGSMADAGISAECDRIEAVLKAAYRPAP